eukprot:4141130-Pyramimonas_sp.AAC.2
MLYSLALCCTATFVAAFEVVPYLNNTLQLVPMPSPEFRTQILSALGVSVLGAFVFDKLCVLVFAPRLLWAGYVDAWRAMPSRGENIAQLGKAAAVAAVVGLYIYTENFLVVLMAYYFYKQLKKKEDRAKAEAEVRLAGGSIGPDGKLMPPPSTAASSSSGAK